MTTQVEPMPADCACGAKTRLYEMKNGRWCASCLNDDCDHAVVSETRSDALIDWCLLNKEARKA